MFEGAFHAGFIKIHVIHLTNECGLYAKNLVAPNEAITMHLTRLKSYPIFINITDSILCIKGSI